MLQCVNSSTVTDGLKQLHSIKISVYFYQLTFNIQEDFNPPWTSQWGPQIACLCNWCHLHVWPLHFFN